VSETPPAAGSSLPSRSLGTLPSRRLNSLRSRGLKPTLRYIRAYADDALFELQYGVRTDRWVEVADLEVVGNNKDHAVNYQPVKVLSFRSAIGSFQIPLTGSSWTTAQGKAGYCCCLSCMGSIAHWALSLPGNCAARVKTILISFALEPANNSRPAYCTWMRLVTRSMTTTVSSSCSTLSAVRCSNLCSATSVTRYSPSPVQFTSSMRIRCTAGCSTTTHFGALLVKPPAVALRHMSITNRAEWT
jgi:hypothetical protein